MKKILLIFSFLVIVFGVNTAWSQVSVISTGGSSSSASYSTLGAAITAVNSGVHGGTIEISIHSNTIETASVSIDSSGSVGGAIYSSILIKPADSSTVNKVVSTSVLGVILLNLQGADNITIDGRPMGLGTNRFLTFQHTNTTSSNSFTCRLINGASNNVFRYVNFLNGTFTLAGGVNFQLSTSAATNSNSNDSIYNCEFNGGRACLQAAGTLANPMTNIYVGNNLITNWSLQGATFSAIRNLTVEGNTINQLTTSPGNVAPQGMFLTVNVDAANWNFRKNRIERFRVFGTTTALNVLGVIISPAAAAPVTIPVLNFVNNIISITDTATSTANRIVGVQYQGTTNPLVLNFQHNTIRISGTQLVSANGNPTSIGFYKTNSAAASNLNFRNNLISNTRTGTANQHIAVWNQTAANGINTMDYNTYWAASVFKVALIGTFYDVTTSYRLAAFPQEQHSIIATPFFTTTTDILLSTTLNSPSNFIGTPIATVTSDYFDTPRSSTIPYRGAFEGPPIVNFQDAKVVEVYTFGKLPIPYAVPHQLRANISNDGIDTLFNQWVRLNISGANTFSDSTLIAMIPPNGNVTAILPAYSPANTGTNNIVVSVPPDSTNNNNTKSFTQLVTNNSYAYADPSKPAIGGVGFNGNSGDFIAKYPLAGSNSINQVGVNFFGGGNTYQIVIYDNLNDTPGVLLWNSSTLTSVTGVNTIPVNPAVPVSGTFYVGVRQIGNINVNFAYQSEDPIRNQTFFYKAVTVNSWADFASTNSAFRFMVEPRLTLANDVGMTDVIAPCNTVIQNSAPFAPIVSIYNYGLNAQTSIPITCSITGPATYSQTSTFLGPIANNGSANITFPVFNPTTVGTYTLRAWSSLSTDAERGNDTLSFTFDVTNLAAPTVGTGTSVLLNGTTNYLSVNGLGSLNVGGNKLSVEAWVRPLSLTSRMSLFAKDADTLTPSFNLEINPGGTLSFTTGTSVGNVTLTSTKTLTTLLYSHIAAVYDGVKMKLLINGDTAGEIAQSGNIATNTNDFYIGCSANRNRFFGGNIDEMRVWDTVRTDAQIRTNMHSRLPNMASAKLISYWRFDDNIGLFAADASGNCNSAKGNAGVSWANSTLPIYSSSVYSYQPAGSTVNFTGAKLNLEFVNLSGTGNMGAYYFPGVPYGTSPITAPGGVTNVHNNFWLVYKYGTFSFDSAMATFQLNPGNLSANANSNNVFAFTRNYYDDANWGLIQGFLGRVDSVNIANQTVRLVLGSTTQFNNQFSIGANNSPLPVTYKSILVKKVDDGALINWSTASEIDNSHFVIERSLDGKNFEAIAQVKGMGTSNKLVEYKHLDAEAFNLGVKTLYYRIAQVDFDGTTSLSKIVSLALDENQEMVLNTVQPNPFESGISVGFTLPSASEVSVEVMNLNGQTLLTQSIQGTEGYNQVSVPETSSLPAGVYFLKLGANGKTTLEKLVKLQ
ncbi:MAG: LamG-like jellyroll fold domain-containing protein [Bacteroidia bacterium]